MRHLPLHKALFLMLALAPAYTAAAQDITVDSVFQTLTISTTEGFVTGDTCAANLQTPPAASGTVVDADDSWMQCPSYQVAMPAGAALTLHSTSDTTTLSGEYSALNADSTNGTFAINNASIGVAGISCSNSPLSFTATSLKGGVINSVNQPVQLNRVVMGTKFELTNANLVGRTVIVPKGKRIRIQGTNSDVNLRGLRCGPASADLSKAPYNTAIRSHLIRRVTRLSGSVDLFRVTRVKGRLKYTLCATLLVTLTNGSFTGR